MFLSNVDAINQIEGSALDKIWAFVYRLVVANAVNFVGSAVFFNEFRSLRGDDRSRIIDMRDSHEAMLRRLLADGIATGVICPRLEPKLTATATLTMCNAIYRWYRPGDEWAPEFIAHSYADLVQSQIACNPVIHEFHANVDRAGLIERLHSLALLPSVDVSKRA
jgi:hypothetical protein